MATIAKITTCDCETDPFLHQRIGRPFIWGFYDGKEFSVFNTTDEFVNAVKHRKIIIYAHNGGKFDFMYLLPFIGETKAQIINGRIVSMKLGEATLIDSYAAVPQSLKSIKKDEIEYWKLEQDVRHNHMPEIINYLRGDCVYLHELMTAYRKAAGTKRTIASNALAHAKRLGIDPGTTNHRFDQNYRPYYYGGRTECFQPGKHENIRVLDIKSSYPYAMLHDHPSGNAMVRRKDFGDLNRDEIQRSFITLFCFSKGAFPFRNNNSEGLSFPHAEHEYNITGWEYIAAKDNGLIENEKILEVRYTKDKINFGDYVKHWYDYKNNHSKKIDGKLIDPINYTIGKIMMNSLYGKLAQNPERYHDYKIMPVGSPLPCANPSHELLNKKDICRVCGFHVLDHGWKKYTIFEGKEFHRRESLWQHHFRFGIEWESKPIYKNVATGASVTGFARAHLLKAIHLIGADKVIYCDTDSLVVTADADISVLPMGKEIGNWDLEIDRAPLAYFEGKKLYGIDLGNGKKCNCGNPEVNCERHKVVTKGGKLTFKDMIKLDKGGSIGYQPAAPSFSIANGINFCDRTFRRTAQ